MPARHARASLITPPGEGGIAVIAVVGPDAARVLDAAFVGTRRAAAELPPGRIAHGTIRRGEEAVDEVLVAHVPAGGPGPEQAHFEVGCHGGIVAARAVLRRLEEAGAEPVEPSRLIGAPPAGLSAEAIRARALALLPRAPTRLGASMLLRQADGALRRELDEIAAPADEPTARERLDALLATAPLGRALLAPPQVALLGPPNVGKSTLLNALLERERVIVHHEPGTTRDVVRETVSIRGMPFDLMDSAGIRQAEDELERQAVERASGLAARCDVALLLFDVREGPEDAVALLPSIREGARAVLVGNKLDLVGGEASAELPEAARGLSLVCISARERINLPALEEALLAPYVGALARCRAGGAILFDEASAGALRRLRARSRS